MLHLCCCSVDDGVSDGQFVNVSGVSPSNNRGNRNTFSHHSLHHVQISLIQPWDAQEILKCWRMDVHVNNRLTLVSQTELPEFIFPMRVDACVVQNQVWTESVQQPGKVSLHCGSSNTSVSSMPRLPLNANSIKSVAYVLYTHLWRGTPCPPAHHPRWCLDHSVVYGGGNFSHSALRT